MQTTNSVFTDQGKTMEVRLWQAVIVTAIQEWVSGPLRLKREAEEFLFRDQRDFPMVCQSAGFDVGRLRSKLERLKPSQQLHPSNLPEIWGKVMLQQ